MGNSFPALDSLINTLLTWSLVWVKSISIDRNIKSIKKSFPSEARTCDLRLVSRTLFHCATTKFRINLRNSHFILPHLEL